MPEDEVEHDLKQKAKLDKIAEFLATNKEKLGNQGKPVKSNITDPDSAKMTTSKGTIQGYNGIAINDDKHQIILQAQTWGSVGEQQTLKPAIEQLEEQLSALNTPDALHRAKTPRILLRKQAQKQNISKKPANIECAKMKNKIFQKRKRF